MLDLFGIAILDEPDRIELEHLLEYLADGPVKATEWQILDSAPPELVAPGGAVLCVKGTLVPHEDAEAKARAAWSALNEWRSRHAAG